MNFTKKENKEFALSIKDKIIKRTKLLRESKMWKNILKEKEICKKEYIRNT